jgi:mannosyltransferase OCH1-like enzyme
MLPDYVLKKWDMNSIKNIDSIFLKEAIAEKRWAYAADFIRLYAIYNEGGIYLDTDAQVFKSFDPFLDYKAFIGREFSFIKIGKFVIMLHLIVLVQKRDILL